MSMNEHDAEDYDDGEEHDEEQDGGADDAPKKGNKTVMAAAIGGVVLVFAFVGYQVYTKFAAPSGGNEQMMAEPLPISPAAQPVVAASLGQPAQADPGALAGSPVAAADPTVAPVGAMGAQPALGGQALDAAPAGPSQVPASSPAVSLAQAGGAIDMSALNGLKQEQETQSKRIESFEDRIAKLEARIAQFGEGRPARVASYGGNSSSDAAERRAAKKAKQIAAAKKKLSAKKALSKKERARLEALKQEEKAAKEAARQAWLKKVAARKKEQQGEEVVLTKKSPAATTIKLPPAPDLGGAKPEAAKPEASKQAAPSIRGLRVQAVIPGRAWVQDDSGATRSFAVGDSIKSGVVIRSIDADKGVVETSIGNIR